VASVLADKAVDEMLALLARHAPVLVATQSSNPRVLEATQLAERARRYFAEVETVPDPVAALARAHARGGTVLVTGSLYLLADLAQTEEPDAR
jgi:folylpolyglutamate synthase/dihydropteroate synthase